MIFSISSFVSWGFEVEDEVEVWRWWRIIVVGVQVGRCPGELWFGIGICRCR